MLDPLEAVQSRKWLITINNPGEHGFDHNVIRDLLSGIKGNSLYWCMCDEKGDECETLHTHIFLYRSSPFTAKQINNLFPSMHRDRSHGSAAENRAYVLKDGSKFDKKEDGSYFYTDSNGKDHVGVNFSATFEEFGCLPEEHQGKSSAADLIVTLVRDGASNRQIVDAVSSAYKDIDKIERIRSMYRDDAFVSSWRNMSVTYIFGATGTGKTRGVMDAYGYANCYRVTDYRHPFDTYDGQDVLIFEEFRGGLKHGDMLNYLDGYPLLLPCRYFNRQACYTNVFIISNVPPDEQYMGIDQASRDAFFRRINTVLEYTDKNKIIQYNGVFAYQNRYDSDWTKAADAAPELLDSPSYDPISFPL